MSTTIECHPTGGVFVREQLPSTRYYTTSKSQAQVSFETSKKFYNFTHIALPADIAGKRVISAKFYQRMTPVAGTPTMTLQRHSSPPVPYAEMVWNNRSGALAGSTGVPVTQSGAIEWWVFDVTTEMQQVALGDPYFGFVLTTNRTTQWRGYGWASESPPYLLIELDDSPAAPIGLEPHGAVAVAKPIINWQAASDIIKAELQIAATTDPDFTAPVFSSGTITLTNGPQLDLNALGYSGIGSGTSVLIRLRHTNAIATSDWSDAITVTYTPLGTLTGSSPASTTADPTPTVAWSFTGTQARWQVTTFRDGVQIEDTGVVAGTDVAYRPAKGATVPAQVLSYRIRVWDNVARTPSPTDKGYAEITKTSTYTPGSITAVTTLTVAQTGVEPWPTLTWTRAAGVADEWIVVRNGEIIARFDGVVGMTYKDWECPPNTAVVYKVFPVTGGVVGSTSPTVNYTAVVDGVWVFDPDNVDYFTISGSSFSMSYAESSVVYEPIGGTSKVKRTWALRGIEGSMSGLLDEWGGRSIATQAADLMAMKGRPDQSVRMILGDINIPICMSNLSPIISPENATTDKIRKDVSFDFYQTGELPFPEVGP